tara:strand:- start:2796 stop:3290 length:495 start_codon:yes stop_codon:yes gene_type:complete
VVIPEDFKQFQEEAKKKRKENQQFLRKLKKKKDGQVDQMFQNAHEAVFSCTDCLKCANCCKTTGPMLTPKDIERIAKHLKLKPGAFVEQYLRIDEDRDYVFQDLPCPFLAEDNYCGIYEVRPKACREYPHTDRKKMRQILNLTAKNVEICPAVFEIVEQLKRVN